MNKKTDIIQQVQDNSYIGKMVIDVTNYTHKFDIDNDFFDKAREFREQDGYMNNNKGK